MIVQYKKVFLTVLSRKSVLASNEHATMYICSH